MTKKEVNTWLVDISDAFLRLQSLNTLKDSNGEEFTSEYGATSIKNSLSITNIEEVAEIMGVQLSATVFSCGEPTIYKTRLSFIFNGVEFMMLTENEVSYYE